MADRKPLKTSPLCAVLGVLFGPLILLLLFPLLVLSSPFIILWLGFRLLRTLILRLYVAIKWKPKGKFILFVYSDSKNWKGYCDKNIIPKIEKSSYILNWSERSLWEGSNMKVEIFKFWTKIQFWDSSKTRRNKLGVTGSEYVPVAIVFKGFRVKVLRFYKAFKDYKHGKSEKLKNLERELFSFT